MTSSLLVLGGTSWLGGAVARNALAAGHQVTCLARGTLGEVPDGAEHVRADRDALDAYAAVRERKWDAVVDVSRQPTHVRSALEALRGVGHWVFVSTCSVYAWQSEPHRDESAPLLDPWTGTGLATDDDYGPAKVACEQAVLSARPDALVARSGLIVGHGDPTDRFGYWPGRVAQACPGEAMLVPPLDDALQVVDVEVFARWLVRCAVEGVGGVMNVMSEPTSFRTLVEACALAAGVLPRFVEADGGWLVEHEVAPWSGPDSLPLWLPRPEYSGLFARDTTRAHEAGLGDRLLLEVVRDALRWETESGLARDRRAGLTRDRETGLLAALDQLGSSAPA